jgi:F-type H+-transporting ATPase subunit b
MKENSRKLRESKTSTRLFAYAVAELQLVLTLAMFNVIAIPASALTASDSPDSNRQPVARASVAHISPGNAYQDEYADLKLSPSVRRLAHVAGLSPEMTFQLCWGFNFSLMVALMFWKGWPLLTAAFEARSRSIRRAIDEAQHLSEDARKRLMEVERRWAQLDSEIVAIQERAEVQMRNEEQILSTRTTEDIRRIVEYAKFEIDRAAQRARDELKASTAGLAVSLARQAIRIDERSDQELVKGFIQGLGPHGPARSEAAVRALANVKREASAAFSHGYIEG